MSGYRLLLEDAKIVNKQVDLSPFADKSILITGASGMVGMSLVYSIYRFIIQTHSTVNVIGTFLHDLPYPLKYLGDTDKRFNFRQGNLTDEGFINSLPKVDFIFHTATYGQPGAYLTYKIETLALNTGSTISLISNHLKAGGSFLFFSSSSVYIGLDNPPFNEKQIGNSNPSHPRSCYIEGKRTGEAVIEAIRQAGINAKSIRLSLAYGPGTKPGDKRALNNFIEKGLLYKKINMLDAGESIRTYCYLSDAITMMYNILFKGDHSVYNVGGRSTISIYELAQLIGEKLDVPVICPNRINDSLELKGAPLNDTLDMTRYNQEFGQVDYIDLDVGLDRTIMWQKYIYNSK